VEEFRRAAVAAYREWRCAVRQALLEEALAEPAALAGAPRVT
jgi:hypothetical protein